jgi:hypothetical protein
MLPSSSNISRSIGPEVMFMLDSRSPAEAEDLKIPLFKMVNNIHEGLLDLYRNCIGLIGACRLGMHWHSEGEWLYLFILQTCCKVGIL